MEIDVFELLWIPLELRRRFKYHVVLVELGVKGADLTLAERVI